MARRTWTPRFRAPLLLVRGRDTYVELEVWGPSGLQPASAGTITIYNEEDAVIVNGQALSQDADGASYTTITASVLPSTLPLSQFWRAEWVLTLAGQSEVFHQDAQLIRRAWSPSVCADDLLAASPQLGNSFNTDKSADNAALAKVIQGAAYDLQVALVSAGKRPWLILEPWKLNAYLVQAALGRVYRSHLFDQDPANAAALDMLATHHEDAAEQLWGAMGFRYDAEETGLPASSTTRSGPPVIRLGVTR